MERQKGNKGDDDGLLLYEDDAVIIRLKPGFIQDPQAFAPGEGLEHIYK